MSRLTVVIPTRDRPLMLERSVASVLASIGPHDEVLVVESASRDPGATAAVARAAGVPCLTSAVGASAARNLGWHAATADLVAFIDDDVFVAPAWAEALTTCADQHPEAAWIAGRIEVPEGQSPEMRAVSTLKWTAPAALDASTPTGRCGHSANLTVRREALEAIDGFDELLGAGGRLRAAEDVDLIDRLLATGRTGYYEPGALAWHDQWRSRRQLIRLDWSYGFGNGARISKLVRRRGQRDRAWRETKKAVWGWGLQPALISLQEHYETRALSELARVAGTFAGFARGLAYPMEGDHLRRVRPRSPSRTVGRV